MTVKDLEWVGTITGIVGVFVPLSRVVPAGLALQIMLAGSVLLTIAGLTDKQ